MRIGFIGDIVGRPGRKLIKHHLKTLKNTYSIDSVIANGENASHGFGLTIKNAHELFDAGVDVITGGNHSWDKKEIMGVMDTLPILRPVNFPPGVPGSGVGYVRLPGYTLAVINLLGHYTMPMCANPFLTLQSTLATLESHDGIVIDFHAEATSEKRALLALAKGKVSAIFGTHTHVGTDDLCIEEGTAYVTDVGLTGCRDNVIGMDAKAPLHRFLTGMPASFDVPNHCKSVLQMVVCDMEGLTCKEAFKLKIYSDFPEPTITKAWHEM